jgi:hypothetical protein
MKRRYDDGGEIDALEEANKREDMGLRNPNAKEYGESGTSYTTKASSKAAAKPKNTETKAERRAFDVPNYKEVFERPVDKTKMSVSERAKATRESARSGSGSTDKRSVNERVRSAMGMKSGGSASSRADGIAQRGKTRGKMC